MIFLQLFYTFLLIGAFTFGGGYSMVALIQNEVVTHHGWMTATEFADLLAISQMTPGPIGINTATYAGYMATLGAGYPAWAAVLGALLASLSVVLVPVTLVLLVGRWLQVHSGQPLVASTMRCLRLAVVGLIAAAALQLLPAAFTSVPASAELLRRPLFLAQAVLFAAVFLLALRRRMSPLLLILLSALAGLAMGASCTTA